MNEGEEEKGERRGMDCGGDGRREGGGGEEAAGKAGWGITVTEKVGNGKIWTLVGAPLN